MARKNSAQSVDDDLQSAVDSAYGILNDANDVTSSREDLAQAVVDALSELEDVASDDAGDDSDDDSDSD
jgi:hypothetical protein